MPFYQDSVFGPSAHSSPDQDRPHSRSRRTSLPPPQRDDASATQPFRRPRELLSPVSSPIPNSPAYHSYRDDDIDHAEDDDKDETDGRRRGARTSVSEREEEEAVADEHVFEVDARDRPGRQSSKKTSKEEEEEEERGQTNAKRGRRRGCQPTSEKYLSLPRSTTAVDDGDDDGSEETRDAEGEVRPQGRRHDGLVSSRPRASPQKARPSSAPRKKKQDDSSDRSNSEGEEAPPWRGHVRQRPFSSTAAAEDEDGRERWKRSSRRPMKKTYNAHKKREERSPPPPQPSTPTYCDECAYPLPAEMEAYLHETSAYASVPWPRCPACGCRLRPTLVGNRRQRDDESEKDEEVNLYSDPETGDGEGDGEGHANTVGRQRSDTAARRPQRSVASAHHAPVSHAPMLVPKCPYLTLESMPRNLATVMKKPRDPRRQERSSSSDEEAAVAAGYGDAVRRRRRSPDLNLAGVPWVTPGCSACGWQCTAALAGVCCCCAMPCVLFRERQQLLFHELESRYICCAGAFPCCVPPVLLRPELYYTVKTEYIDVTVPRRDPQRPRFWDNAVTVSRESDSSGDGSDACSINEPHALAAPQRPPRPSSESVAAFRSATGVASPASLVNPRTGLPFEGCYHNTTLSRGGADSLDSASGIGCCDCVTCVDSTCVFDLSRGCCLSCSHPTAHCLACPLCCLCCELTFCMPCALWANRLLIRQHYNLAPDPAIDSGAACCYSCCLHCCTCHAIFVVSQPHTTLGQQQPRTSSSSRTRSAAKSTESAPALSCWSQMATSVAACLAAVCCLCPCAACSLAQQRDQMERLGFPLVVEAPPEMDMM